MPHSLSLDHFRTSLEKYSPVSAAAARPRQQPCAEQRPIVVLDDGSEAAGNAARRAALVARTLGAPLRRVQAHPMSVDGLAVANARLLVTHFEDAFRPSKWILGTATEQLVRKFSLPVLVVKQPASGRYSHVLIGAKLEPMVGDLLGFAETLAPRSRVNVVHVLWDSLEYSLRLADAQEAMVRSHRNRVYGDSYRKLNDLIADVYAADTTVVAPRIVGGHPPRRMLEFAAATRAGLIVLGKNPNHWLANLLLDSGVPRAVLAEAQSDVLLVPTINPSRPYSQRTAPGGRPEA